MSNFVVDVGWALWGHLLDNVDRVAIVAAHLLVVRAVVVLCPQWNDDVTGLRASRAPGELGIGQRAEGQSRGAGLRMSIFPGPFAHLNEQNDEEEDEQEENDAAGTDDGEDGNFGLKDAIRVARRSRIILIYVVCRGEMTSQRHHIYITVIIAGELQDSRWEQKLHVA